MKQPLKVLFVEDSENDALLFVRALRKAGFDPVHSRVQSASAMRNALADGAWDVILSDYSMPQFTGLEALEVMQDMRLDLPFILVSGTVGEELAVAAMKAGAHDYLIKGDLARLGAAIRREMEAAHSRAERRTAEAELRRSQEQLFQSQKMESVGRLAGGVAHDFNNLLTVILGSCAFLAEGLAPGDVLHEEVEQIWTSGKRAESLTRQLLAFSRRQTMRPEVLDLNDVLQNLHKMLVRIIREDVELVTLAGDDLWPVEVDPGQIDQVVMNLAVNARDAMPNGGKLTIETANVVLDQEYATGHMTVTPGPFVLIAVSDNGVGMDSATREQVFEPFFTTKEKGKGTGLGMSMVYGIVKQSGGNIWIYSEPGQGTTVKIYLPRSEATKSTPARTRTVTKSRARSSETVLVVEDEPAVRELVVRMLTRFGYSVLHADNGLDAMTASRNFAGPIDLLLTDVVMPGPNGRETAEMLLAARPDMAVLYMSGYTDNAIVHHGVLDSGMTFLEKPFSPDGLDRKIREVLNKASQR